MIEGSWSVSLTNGYWSGMAKNISILRIRILNTAGYPKTMSVPNPWHCGTDPNPRICTSDYRIRIRFFSLMTFKMPTKQCCGSETGIRRLYDPWIRNPGWVKNLDPDPGEQPGSYFRQLRNNFLGKNTKILWCESGMEKKYDLGSGMENCNKILFFLLILLNRIRNTAEHAT